MRITATLAIVLLAGSFQPFHAAATPGEITAKRQEAEAARVRLDELATDLEERTEEYLDLDARLQETRLQVGQAEDDLAEAEQSLAEKRQQLSSRARDIYTDGPIDVISVLLGVSDFEDFVSRIDILRRIGRSDARLVADVKSARSDARVALETLERRRSEAETLRDAARTAQAQVKSALDAQTSYLARVDAELSQLIKEERARQEALAREAAQNAVAGRPLRGGREFDPAALGTPHPEVVTFARSFVDKTPYVWGGSSPSGFDCSGLTSYCYRLAGISLPRTSRSQYLVGAFIPPDRLDLLSPGDLVFFGRDGDPNRIHHVGIYIGGGEMIHAPQTGELVSVASLIGRISSRADYVGAVRP